jgi:hypothetical protein
MERATKLLVLAWVLAALAAKAWLMAGDWPALPALVALFTLGAAALVAIDRRGIAAVLVFTSIYPAVIYLTHGRYHLDYTELWLGPLVGAMLPDALRSSWHVPLRWRRALVTWACVIAVAVPLVIVREMDFEPQFFLTNSAPRFAARWELHVGLVALGGLLWFDWLFSEKRPAFIPWIVAPQLVSAALMAAAAVYQGVADIFFLNDTTYAVLHRASGTLFDANLTGTLAALWIGGVAVLAARLDRWRTPVTIAGIAAAGAAVWMTGSRTAFAAATLVTLFVITRPKGERGGREPWPRTWKIAGAAVLLLAGLLMLRVVSAENVGPIARLRNTMPSLSAGSVRAFAVEMWNRNGYGAAATNMIRAYPFFGVGIGSFYGLARPFAIGYDVLPDNAQNWYRHLLAELGIVGSIGWMEWTVLFAMFVFRPRSGAPPSLWILRGMLVAFAAISLVGVPGQMLSVVITFWTLAYWYALSAGAPPASGSLSPRSLAAVAVVVAVFAAGTGFTGWTRLRPPVLARTLGQPYGYGFYPPEPTTDGSVRQWARQVAAQTIDVRSAWLEVSVSVNHYDIQEHPVDARVSIDGRDVIDTTLTSTEPKTVYVGIRPAERWALMRTHVNRVVRPRALGVADDRELGLLVSWRFVNAPPPGERSFQIR